ncbi:MAG: 4Fe-4S dicluster domain-containing protein, partial [Pseudomonadota bacterium]
GILTFTTYTLAGMMREQVCTYMCPWPRIQAALTDEETLQVTYKVDRGEPRGSHKKNASWEGRGDCVDCHGCVVVCPMGIDIRDGAQLECINCALCIDACDEVMEKVGRPKGLIGYDSDKNIERRQAGLAESVKIFRSRTVFYASALAIVSAVMLFALSTRSTLEVNILRDRSPSFVQLSDGSIRNAYTLKIVNKSNRERQFLVALDQGSDQQFDMTGVGLEKVGTDLRVMVNGDDVRSMRIFLTAPSDDLAKVSTPVVFVVTAEGAENGEKKAKSESSRNPSVFLRGRAQ